MYFRCLIVLLLALPVPSLAAEKKDKNRYEDDDIVFRVVPRQNDNIAAFYEGRGFSKEAIAEINKTCYITFLMRNRSRNVIWLDLDSWRVTSEDKTFKRLTRSYWKQKWQEMGVSLAHQATFGWSLLPDVRNLYPDEPVGGSVTYSFTDAPITVEAHFKLGEDKDKGEKVLRFENVRCVEK